MALAEWAANGLMVAAIVLAGRNNIHSWWLGIAGCLMFLCVFLAARLYADATLQLFFIATNVAGWIGWSSRGGPALPIARTDGRVMAGALLAAMGATACYGAVLHRFTNAYAPFLDSAVLALSIMAQWLLMRRRIETWPVWIAVNTLAVPLYASRGLYVTAACYAAYWINGWIALHQWRRLMKGATHG